MINNFLIKLLFVFILMTQSILYANSSVFPVSTEMQIGKIRNLVNKAPNGIYLTVGGERAFRGASMFVGIEHLIITDISPTIIKYNKINIELLRAPTKENYKFLRWNSKYAEWKNISKNLSENDFKWWEENIRNMKGYDLPERLNRYGYANKYIKFREKIHPFYQKLANKFNNREDTFLTFVSWPDIEKHQKSIKTQISKEEFDWFDAEKKLPNSCIQKFIDDPSTAIEWGQVIDYKSGNYLFNDNLYKRLHELVLKKMITVIEADLSEKKGLDSITEVIQNSGSKLTVLDLDNLYLYDYMGEEKFRAALSKFLNFGLNDSILILMNNYKDYGCAQFSIYVGFTFENVKSWPKDPFFDAFINSVPSELQPLLDGRLYEANDVLPFYLMRKNNF